MRGAECLLGRGTISLEIHAQDSLTGHVTDVPSGRVFTLSLSSKGLILYLCREIKIDECLSCRVSIDLEDVVVRVK